MCVTVPLPSDDLLIGRIVRLQVQREPLKDGPPARRTYDPAPLLDVSALLADADGCRGVNPDGEPVLDVHHRHHPRTRDPKGKAGLTFMSVADYDRLRADYGRHVVDGAAGESILLATDAPLTGRDLSAGVVVEAGSADGEPLLLPLSQVRPAAPCVEFSRWCLGLPKEAPVDQTIKAALIDLDGGARGFRAVALPPSEGQAVVIRTGARVWAATR
jgi:hypothetical protein